MFTSCTKQDPKRKRSGVFCFHAGTQPENIALSSITMSSSIAQEWPWYAYSGELSHDLNTSHTVNRKAAARTILGWEIRVSHRHEEIDI